jgi:hypothetical protein
VHTSSNRTTHKSSVTEAGRSVGQLLHLGGNEQIDELVANVHHEAVEDAGVHLCSFKGENELGTKRKERGPWC